MKNTQKALFFAVLMTVPGLALAGTMTGGATFPEQIVQEVTEVQTKVTEAQQLVQEIQQYENMVQNMATLPQSMMNQIMQPISQMYSLAQEAQGLGTAGQNIASQFQNMNVGFDPQASSNFEQQYSSATDNLNSAINNALQAANLNPSNFLTQQQAMSSVTQAMQNPTSRNAILQAGGTVGQAEVSDLTQIAQTATAQETMQAAYDKDKVAQQNNNVQAGENALEHGLSGVPLTSNSQPLTSFDLSGYHH
ncbi:hypothetical protein A6O24_15470 [Acidithiobacillus thiooxidans]|uniref:hypothetical protein n=1 Tax=Acidithiobacillus thiooxidans TaxID=930 RepID=UPI00085699D6|nr:hypothetical protein [Acidithiobacillus thiooxidans]OCX71340.1 hypothetical protein A6O24_15470 [Acidithiobacillus thiooxidans]